MNTLTKLAGFSTSNKVKNNCLIVYVGGSKESLAKGL